MNHDIIAHKDSTCVRVSKQTHKELKFLCALLNQRHAQFLSELIHNIYSIGCTFKPKSLNLEYEGSIIESSLNIYFSGRNRLITGEVQSPDTATNKEVDSAIRKDFKKQLKAQKKNEMQLKSQNKPNKSLKAKKVLLNGACQ